MKEYPTVGTADLYTSAEFRLFSTALSLKSSRTYTAAGNQYLSGKLKDLILHLAEGIDQDHRSWERQDSLV